MKRNEWMNDRASGRAIERRMERMKRLRDTKQEENHRDKKREILNKVIKHIEQCRTD